LLTLINVNAIAMLLFQQLIFKLLQTRPAKRQARLLFQKNHTWKSMMVPAERLGLFQMEKTLELINYNLIGSWAIYFCKITIQFMTLPNLK
tara:strand:+ start:1147 stop:1419 length:273 start_codon:yes stop_codon:yes gene_type:complete